MIPRSSLFVCRAVSSRVMEIYAVSSYTAYLISWSAEIFETVCLTLFVRDNPLYRSEAPSSKIFCGEGGELKDLKSYAQMADFEDLRFPYRFEKDILTK